MASKPTEIEVVINASREAVWEVLFSEYGDIHVHNPTMVSSQYMHGATEGALGCLRHCQFSDKLFLEERITQVDELRSVTIAATEHNLPFMRRMSATYELADAADGATLVTMRSATTTSPWFLVHLLRGRQKRDLGKHLFGMKYFIETGNTVGRDDYDEVFGAYEAVVRGPVGSDRVVPG